jgi:cytochrome b
MSDVMEGTQARGVAVWDPVVRYGHWLLFAAFAAAYLSAEEESTGPDALHVWGGYVAGIIVVLRLLWGFIGPQRARFTDFIYGPVTVSRYLIDLVRGRARRYLGHSPAGGAMVVLLLLSLAATVLTGLMAYGEQGKGPLAEGGAVVVAAYADADEVGRRGIENRRNRSEGESVLGEVHGTLANITLALVILHVLGVGWASLVHRENLVLAMITGRKRADRGQAPSMDVNSDR